MQKNDFNDLLFEAVLKLENKEECAMFFKDICTPKEIDTIAQRFMVAKMINEKNGYNEIIERTNASTATISRVSRSMDEGLKIVLERLEK